jgi:hypothetical protein
MAQKKPPLAVEVSRIGTVGSLYCETCAISRKEKTDSLQQLNAVFARRKHSFSFTYWLIFTQNSRTKHKFLSPNSRFK